MDEAFKGTYKNLHPFLHTFIVGNSVKLLYKFINSNSYIYRNNNIWNNMWINYKKIK